MLARNADSHAQSMLRIAAPAKPPRSASLHFTRGVAQWARCIESVGKIEGRIMTPVGFEPTQLALVELESTPLDHSGKVSLIELLLKRCLVCVSQFTSAGSAVRKHTPETRHPSLLHPALGMALVTAASIAASYQHGSHAHEAPGC